MSESVGKGRSWAVRLPDDKAIAAAALRLWPGLSVRMDDAAGGFWIRGGDLTESLELELRKLPGAQRYTIDHFEGDEVLLPVGRQLPAGFVPEDNWKPIVDWFRPALSPGALAGTMSAKSPLTLVRSDRAADANVLITALHAWTAWALDAPQVRLRRLSFAASDDGRVVVRGSPLPPIPGRPHVERQGVAVTSGWQISPDVDAATFRMLLEISETDLAVFHEDGGWERVPADAFVAASRAAARATSDDVAPASGL